MDLVQFSKWLKALAEPKRLQIFNLLMEGVQCNCELGEALHMTPNLISHHLSKLRNAGLVDAEHDTLDSRWVYYSVNQAELEDLNTAFETFFNAQRIQPRHPTCGPQGNVVRSDKLSSQS
ncbi:MAG: metalloregulator ArsR/SmtB family transcription factor [Anaerolineaceae bacterium]|nr:metalloregulator ArsR/SmtB family transcription factor [Anaerolineaceae bacterium]